MGHIYSEQQAQSTTRKQVFVATAAMTGASGQSIFRHSTGDRPLRVILKNHDASIVLYLGDSAVTSSTGLALAAGESVSLDVCATQDLTDLYCVAASGTPNLGILVIGQLGN